MDRSRVAKVTVVFVAAGLLGLVGYGASVQVRQPPAGNACRPGTNCAECHEGSVPRTHSRSFIDKNHGLAATADRTACAGCHKPQQCEECHAKTKPAWHTEGVCRPKRGPEERLEHSRVGMERKTTCIECHAARFIQQCSACHQRGEWP